MSKHFVINIDTVVFKLTGMDFKIPGARRSIAIDDDGECVNTKQWRVEVPGKNGSHSLYVSSPDSGKSLVIEGSPGGFLFGQNLYTSHKLHDLILPCIKAVCRYLGLNVPQSLKQRWLCGEVYLLRVDLFVNFLLESDAQVVSALTQIAHQAIGREFGICGHGTTVYFKPDGGKAKSTSFYAKHAEMRHTRRFDGLVYKERLIAAADGILRVEVTNKAPELKRLKLNTVALWDDKSPFTAFTSQFLQYKFLNVTSGPLLPGERNQLPPRLRPVQALHKLGADLTLEFSERTLQRHRAAFRKYGIDIRCPHEPTNRILDITKLLSLAKAQTTPEWLLGEGLAPKRS